MQIGFWIQMIQNQQVDFHFLFLFFTLSGGEVSWKSSKQTCTTKSTMESDFVDLMKAGIEAGWLKNFLADVPIWSKPVPSNCFYTVIVKLQ